MSLLNWYLPLDACLTLDDVRTRWDALLEEHSLYAGSDDPRYQDALLSFLANSRLPASLRLGALLTCVSSVDLDLRVALGLLAEEIDEVDGEWPETVGNAAPLPGPFLSLPTADPWLAAFAVGRLVGLRETLQEDGTTEADWRQVFWNKYLELACRWADSDGVRLALKNGADVQRNDASALIAVAEGLHAHSLRTPYYMEQRSHADYRAILHLLRDAGTGLRAVSDIVLPAAAAVDNVDMLEELVSSGADLQDGGPPALVAAASNFAPSAVEWLIARGVSVHWEQEAALIGAIDSLNEPMVETLLAAGADIHAGGELPLCTAAHAQPDDLYNGGTGFIGERAEMIALLLRHGADASHPAFAAALSTAPDAQEVLASLVEHEDIDETMRAALQVLGAREFSGGPHV